MNYNQTEKIYVANFMDSSLHDIEMKGVMETLPFIYNPFSNYEKVIHFTPHAKDMVYCERLKSSKIELITHGVGGLEPIKIFKALILIWRNFGSKKINIVRGRLPYLGSMIGGIIARLKGIPFVVSLGGDNRIVQERNEQYYLNSKLLSYGIEKYVMMLANKIIVPNQYSVKYVEEILGKKNAEEKCVCIPWILKPIHKSHDEEIIKKYEIDESKLIIPIIGFINKYKFSDVIFEALLNLREKSINNKTVIFYFIGDGPLACRGKELFKGRDDVKFLGWQSNTVVHTFLSCAHFVLIPMSGFVMLEAASLGKVVISSNIEWHSEIIKNGFSGILINPYDSEEWLSSIENILDNYNEVQVYGDRLKITYEERYSADIAAASERDLYLNLIEKYSR